MSELWEENAFTVKDDAAAEWCMQKIREAEADRAMWKKHYDSQMEKVNQAADSAVAYFTAKLEEYFDAVPHKAAKASESYALPSGKLIRKKQQPKFDVDDEQLVPWLIGNGYDNYVQYKASAKWAEIKKFVTVSGDGVADNDGLILPGVTVTQRPDVFKVEVQP